jgi:hypothetical protein
MSPQFLSVSTIETKITEIVVPITLTWGINSHVDISPKNTTLSV